MTEDLIDPKAWIMRFIEAQTCEHCLRTFSFETKLTLELALFDGQWKRWRVCPLCRHLALRGNLADLTVALIERV